MCTAFHNIRNDKIFSNGVAEWEYQNKLSSNTLLNIEWLASVLFRFRYAILLCTNIAMLSKTAAWRYQMSRKTSKTSKKTKDYKGICR